MTTADGKATNPPQKNPQEIARDSANTAELNAGALDTVSDNAGPDSDGQGEQRQQPQTRAQDGETQPRELPKREMTRGETRRAEILKNFRQHRDETAKDGDGDDIRAFTHNGMPPELVPLQQQADAAEGQGDGEGEGAEATGQQQPQAPQKRKLVVRGKEVELTEDEIVAAAQKSLAGDDYLEEGKAKLKEINELYHQAKTNPAAPARQNGTHPAAQQTAQDGTEAGEQGEEGEHHADPFVELAESIQFKTPEEAAPLLRQTITAEAQKGVKQELQMERMREETLRSNSALQSFKASNKELASDPNANAVIERSLYDLQREDLVTLGHDPSQLPQTPKEIANWHLYYRSNGFKVRPVDELLTAAKDGFLKWKGVAPQPTNEQPAVRRAEPRIEVALDRNARRTAIPTQPTRSAAPRPPANGASQQPVDRSAVVQRMKEQRRASRGAPPSA